MKNFKDFDNWDEYRAYTDDLHIKLLKRIKSHVPEMKERREKIDNWDSEDLIYRFYHRSFKVYYLQGHTLNIMKIINDIAGDEFDIDPMFKHIVENGVGIEFDMEHNKDWQGWTRPIVEAYFHARYFLDMMIKYGEELEGDVRMLPSGWAAILSIFCLR